MALDPWDPSLLVRTLWTLGHRDLCGSKEKRWDPSLLVRTLWNFGHRDQCGSKEKLEDHSLLVRTHWSSYLLLGRSLMDLVYGSKRNPMDLRTWGSSFLGGNPMVLGP